MPGDKSADKKKGKSKAAKKKEEAERKAREEEEARQRAEKEEAERQAQLKVQDEQKRKLEIEQDAYLRVQLAEVYPLLARYQEAVNEHKANERRTAKWERYMRCDGSPDPTIPGEINTYINLQQEEMTSSHDQILKQTELTLALIDELNRLVENTPPDELNPNDLARYQEVKAELAALLSLKLDEASYKIFLSASTAADPETQNFQTVVRNSHTQLLLWANLAKNQRIKGHLFDEEGIQFELPKYLTTLSCALRIMISEFDPYSPRSRTFHCKTTWPTHKLDPPPQPEVVVEEKPVEVKQEEANVDFLPPELRKLMEADDEDKSKEKDKAAAEAALEAAKPEDVKEEQPPDASAVADDVLYEGEVDLRTTRPLGGIFHIDLLQLPAQPKNVNKWTLRQLDRSSQIRAFPYPTDPLIKTKALLEAQGKALAPEETSAPAPLSFFERAEMMNDPEYMAELEAANTAEAAKAAEAAKPDDATDAAHNGTSSHGEKNEDLDGIGGVDIERDEQTPFGMDIKLPRTAFFAEPPTIARWDSGLQQWRTDGFLNVKFVEEEKKLHFETYDFGPFSLMEDLHVHMPFQQWELRPKGINNCVFTLVCALELQIEVKGCQCALIGPRECPEVAHLLDAWMSPRSLLKSMRVAGVNVVPEPDSHRYVGITKKDAKLEWNLYQQMALTSACVAFGFSHFNGSLGDEHRVVLQAAPHLTEGAVDETEWLLFLFDRRHAAKLEIDEYAEAFSDSEAPDWAFCSSLYHVAKAWHDDTAMQRVENVSPLYVDAVFQVLDGCKCVTYS